jgi:hypothetical protein
VVELDAPCLIASAAVGGDERTPAAVTLPHDPPDFGRDVAEPRSEGIRHRRGRSVAANFFRERSATKCRIDSAACGQIASALAEKQLSTL